jgi:hypothetical protein
MAQIDEILARKRLQVTPETLQFTPRRRGGTLPLIVNLAALLVVAAGIFLAVLFSRRDEQTIITAPVTLQTAEGKLLEAMKQESQQQLESKDRELSGIREKLAGIDKETERIRQEADARVQDREKTLQDQLSRTLEEERRKLQASDSPAGGPLPGRPGGPACLLPQAGGIRKARAGEGDTAAQDGV